MDERAFRVRAAGLALDAVTVEVIEALSAHGIRSILIKGAAIAAWLYDDPAERPYGDADLLVAPADFARAQAVLARLGFREMNPPGDGEQPRHDSAWRRATAMPGTIDLHRWLYWGAHDPAGLWRELSRGTRRTSIAGRELETLSEPAQILVIVGHAVQHSGEARPAGDLSRAIERVDRDVWRSAGELARSLDATGVFVAGVRRVPGGPELITELGLEGGASPEMRLWIDGAPPAAFTLLRLADEENLAARLSLTVRKVLPSRAFIREWLPSTDHPSLPLALAYAYRCWWLARRTPSGLRAWRRAARGSGS